MPKNAATYLDDLIDAVVKRRTLVIFFYLVLTLAMLPGTLKLQQDNAPEIFFVRDAVALQQYADFEFEFGRDRSLRVILEGEGVWQREGLAWIADFERQAPSLRGVIGAVGLYGHHAFRFPQWPPPDPAAFRREVLHDPLDSPAAWINGDGSVVSILVALYKLPPDGQRVALQQIGDLLESVPKGIRASVIGLPLVNQAMDQALTEMVLLFFPLLVSLAVVVLVLSLRHWGQTLALLGFVTACLAVPLGLMGYHGTSFNLVLIILVPLLFVITLATAVHVLMFFRQSQRGGREPGDAVRAAYSVKSWPVIWTGITTGTGFGSLMISAVPPVQSLGFWSLVSIAFMTLAALTLFPAILSTLGSGAGAGVPERWAERQGGRWAGWAVLKPGRVILVFALTTVALLAGFPLLNIESNVLTYFEPDHPMRSEMERVQNAGIGVLGAELLVINPELSDEPDSATQGRFDSPAELVRLVELGDRLRSGERILGGVSAGDLALGVSHYRSPGEARSGEALNEALEFMRQVPEQQKILAYFLSDDAGQARISLLVPMLGFTTLDEVFEQAKRLAAEQFPGRQIQLTGQYPLVLAAQKTLLRTMFLSLSLTLLCIALIFRWVLGSSQLAWRALAPNLWPVIFVLGVMGWSGIPLDSTTVMIAAAVLGLAVDDTLHSLGSFRRVVVSQPGGQAAVTTLRRIAPAHLLTSLVLAMGFAMISLSEFVPVARFGGLAALAILAALLADLLLVPAVLATSPEKALDRLKPLRQPNPDADGAG